MPSLRHPVAVLATLASLCVATFWIGLGSLGITDLDEGLYVAAARDIVLTGDLITPRVGGQPFFEKPPLLYWLVALCISVFGSHEFAARLPSALAATLTVALTYWYGRSFLGRRPAIFGGALLAVSPVLVGSARLATTDALLVLFVTCAMISLYRAWAGGTRSLWWAAAGVFCGLGVLTKGAPGLVLPIATFVVFVLVRSAGTRDLAEAARRLKALMLVLLVAAVVAAPWHFAVWRANGSVFVREYLVRQHVQRFQGGDRGHQAPVWFFVPGFLIGCFPGSLFAVAALFSRRTDAPDTATRTSPVESTAQDGRLFLKTWFWVTFLLFSFGGSKLISYILPLYPAAALLAGDWLERMGRHKDLARPLVFTGMAAGAVLGLLLTALLFPEPVVQLIQHSADRPITLDTHHRVLLREGAALTTILLSGVAFFVLFVRLRQVGAATGALIAGSASFIVAAVYLGIPRIQEEGMGSLHRMTRRAGELIASRGTLVTAVGSPRRPSIYFYLPEPVVRERRVQEASPEHLESADLPDGALVLTRSDWQPSGRHLPYAPLIAERDYTLWKVAHKSVRD